MKFTRYILGSVAFLLLAYAILSYILNPAPRRCCEQIGITKEELFEQFGETTSIQEYAYDGFPKPEFETEVIFDKLIRGYSTSNSYSGNFQVVSYLGAKGGLYFLLAKPDRHWLVLDGYDTFNDD